MSMEQDLIRAPITHICPNCHQSSELPLELLQKIRLQEELPEMGKKSERVSKLDQEKKKGALEWKWFMEKTCLIGQSLNLKPSAKIASFDMDDTLIRTKSGAKFATGPTDWVFWDKSVSQKMQDLQKDGFKLVIFTNQLGVAKGKTNPEHLKKKMEDLAKQMKVELQCFLAVGQDEFRKPGTKMWSLLEQHNGGVKIDKEHSFYCGDAAGRKDEKHKDFSDSDLKFALNVKLEFLTPENLFLGDKTKVEVKGFNPSSVIGGKQLIEGVKDFEKVVEYRPKELIIFVGSPGSGKSTFWQTYMSKYARVNRDTLKSKQKCYKVAEEELQKGNSVIIDNTNPKMEDRKYFMKLAKDYELKCRCFRFTTPKDICFHNDYQRVVNDKRKHLSGKAGSIPIHSFFKYVEEPTPAEGFYEIHKVNFVAKFNDEADKDAYLQFSKK